MYDRELGFCSLSGVRYRECKLYGRKRDVWLEQLRELWVVFQFVWRWIPDPNAQLQFEQPQCQLPGLRLR